MIMDFQFVIPSVNSELLNSNGNNYFVKQVYDAKELPELLKDARNAYVSSDSFYIFDHFDTFFSLIENVNSITLTTMFRASDLLYLSVDKLGQLLTTYIQNNEMTERNSYLNLTKMFLFLTVGIVRAIDHLTMSGDSNVKKPFKRPNYESTAGEWNSKRYKILLQIFNIMQLPLEKLWSQSIPDEEFVNMLCDLAYRTLEHPSIKENRVRDTVFQIFGTSIKRYNHALNFPVKILQILRTCEIAVAPTANGVNLLYEEYGITSIFSILLTDLVDTLSVDAADSQTSKYFSHFLTELGTVAPKLIIPHLSTLAEELLNLESYVLRNCVLQLMGDVVTVELATEELSEDLKEIRDNFLEDLLGHMMDVSAHVRSKVLQIWNHMKVENSVPLVWQNRVLQMAAERLDDKGTLVRKNAIHLIKTFLETNPFAAKLSLKELKVNLEKETNAIQETRNKMIEVNKQNIALESKWMEMAPELLHIIGEMLSQSTQEHMESRENCEDLVQRIASLLLESNFRGAVTLVKYADLAAGNREARLAMQYEEQCAYYAALLKSYLFLNQKDYTEEFTTQEQTIKFLNDSIEFAEIIAHAVPKIEAMLMSKVNSDVFEAVDFFTTAYLFGIKGTECGMRKMLYLVWSGDKEKREAVTKAYNRVLFGTDQTGRSHAIQVVDNLCSFFENITIGHYAAMEILMQEWIDNSDIDNQIIQVMFERFTLKLPDTSDNKARLALQLLIMASAAKPSIVSANVDVIQSIGLEERGLNDPRMFASCLNLLMNSAPQNTSSKYYKRYDLTHPMIEKVVEIFKKMFFYPNIHNFDNVAIKTFEFIYHICQAPDILCQNVLFDLCQKIRDISDKLVTSNGSDNNNSLTLPDYLLPRIIFVFGFIAMKEMIFLDIDVYNNMKYRQDLMEEKKSQKSKNNKRKTVSNMNMSASHALKRLSGSAAEPQQEPDEMLVGATAEDSIAELINFICESELLYSPSGMLPKFIAIVIEILKYPAKYKNSHLQQAACLTLIRFMSVSSKFCENNMQFLMNILNLTKNVKMKCNIVVGLSDFTFRFPNVIEPWTGNFYSTLHERNDELRLTAVKILSHLILHEMIRVKGQISDLAMCIVDPNDEIKNITQQFFKEIANKSNILYNVLPDIISRLSNTDINLEEEKYHLIMKYIIGLIQKDRQVESLVEKLCLRFRVTNEERQWRDIAYCLSLLNYTEKTMKKLTDNILYFKDKVQIDEVYECFKTIITNSSRLAKQEFKVIITDFENKLKDCLTVKDPDTENNSSEQRRSGADMPPPKRVLKRGDKKGQRGKKPNAKTFDSDSEDSDLELRRPQPTPVRSSARKKKVQQFIDTDSSNSSNDEAPTTKRGSRIKKHKK